MIACATKKDTEAIKRQRLFRAFAGVKYDFFAEWLNTDNLAQQLLAEENKTLKR